jgi:hypothetical protein
VDWVPGEVRRAAEGEENSEARYFHYVVHPNWRIVGTMNLYDKSSLFQMSFAFMRRFAFIDLAVPSPVAFYELVEKWFVENGLIEEGDKVPGATLLADLDTMLPLRATFRELLDQRQKEGHLMRIRAIGPAVIKDMIEYMGGRVLDGGAADPREYLAEAFLLYGVPQIDGLAQKNVEAVYKHLGRLFADVAQRATILQRIEALYPHIQDWPEVD